MPDVNATPEVPEIPSSRQSVGARCPLDGQRSIDAQLIMAVDILSAAELYDAADWIRQQTTAHLDKKIAEVSEPERCTCDHVCATDDGPCVHASWCQLTARTVTVPPAPDASHSDVQMVADPPNRFVTDLPPENAVPPSVDPRVTYGLTGGGHSDAVKEAIALVGRHPQCSSNTCFVAEIDARQGNPMAAGVWRSECRRANDLRPVVAALADAERKLVDANIEADKDAVAMRRASDRLTELTMPQPPMPLRELLIARADEAWRGHKHNSELLAAAGRQLRVVRGHYVALEAQNFDLTHRLADAEREAAHFKDQLAAATKRERLLEERAINAETRAKEAGAAKEEFDKLTDPLRSLDRLFSALATEDRHDRVNALTRKLAMAVRIGLELLDVAEAAPQISRTSLSAWRTAISALAAIDAPAGEEALGFVPPDSTRVVPAVVRHVADPPFLPIDAPPPEPSNAQGSGRQCADCRRTDCELPGHSPMATAEEALKQLTTDYGNLSERYDALERAAVDAQVVECAIGGNYEMPDGRSFWIDGSVAREMTQRVMTAIAAQRARKAE